MMAESFPLQLNPANQSIGLQYEFKDANSNEWTRVNKTLNQSNFEDELNNMESKKPIAINVTLNDNESMTTKFFSRNLDFVESLKISKATIPDLNYFKRTNLSSLLLLDLSDEIRFAKTQSTEFGDVFPNLECVRIKKFDLEKLTLNGGKCWEKTKTIMKVSLKGSCECGLKKDVTGTEKEYLKIKAPDPEHETNIIFLVNLFIIGVILNLFLFCYFCNKRSHGCKVYQKLKVLYDKNSENSQQETPDLSLNETVV
jgi:hypothetical protein